MLFELGRWRMFLITHINGRVLTPRSRSTSRAGAGRRADGLLAREDLAIDRLLAQGIHSEAATGIEPV